MATKVETIDSLREQMNHFKQLIDEENKARLTGVAFELASREEAEKAYYKFKKDLYKKEVDEEKKFEIQTKIKLLSQLDALKQKTEADYQKKIESAKTASERNRLKKQLAQELKNIDTLEDARAKKIKKSLDKQAKTEKQAEKNKKGRESRQKNAQDFAEGVFGKGKSFAERKDALNKAFHDENGALDMQKGLSTALNAMSDLAKQLNSDIDAIASKKGAIDTRLQGSSNKKRMGSYWDALSADIQGIAGVSPLVKQEKVVEKVESLVGKGISFNVEQRAFLATLSEKIATTFDATDATLVKLVRIQQADTTAARLGMESALTAFLNNMYETTEYMTDAAATIRANLYQATALMGAESATEFEYQVQKWMGSLYSVGFGKTEDISSTLGKLASGDISGLTQGGTGNLMIMAANNAGLSIADALQEGLDESDTNRLMSAMVDYLAKIYDESQGSKVIQQQFANVYGLTAADLKAAKNLSRSNRNVYNNGLSYGGMLGQLSNMANSMYARTSIGEMMTNAFANMKYGMAAGIANNPVLYATYKAATMLDDLTGGIALPDIKVMGSGVNLQTTVADLMRVAALSGSALSGLGQMIAMGGGGGITGGGILNAIGALRGTSYVSRGTGQGLLSTGPTVQYSESGFVGNADSSDVQNKTMADANESAAGQLAEAEDNSSETKLSTVDEHLVQLVTLFQNVVDGSASLHVDMGNEMAWSAALRGPTM